VKRWLGPLCSIWLLAQLGEYGTSDHCWILRGVTIRQATPLKRFWVTQDPALNGFIQRVEVEKESDLDAAARSVGMQRASQCDGYFSRSASK
jgi:hypothetical protein